MKQYAEAHKIKTKADRLEEIELEKLRSQHAHKLAAQEMQFAQRQQVTVHFGVWCAISTHLPSTMYGMWPLTLHTIVLC